MVTRIKSAIKGYKYSLLAAVLCCLFISACSDSSTNGLGSLPEVTFTATPLSNPNKIKVKSTAEDAFMWLWHFGNGLTSRQRIDTVTYFEQGKYTITLRAFAHGGSATATKQVTIATDYQGQNILPHNGLLTASNWKTLFVAGTNRIDITFKNGKAIFTNTPYSYGAIYLAAQVKAGAKYLFSAHVKGSGMGSQAWFEVYIGTTKPIPGKDYKDNKIASLNTYIPNCGQKPFDGGLVDMSCSGSATGTDGVVTFSKTGTVYVVVKAGSNSGTLGKTGVTLTSISLSKL